MIRRIGRFIQLIPYRRLFPFRPELLNYSMTEKCDGACLMCGIWSSSAEEPLSAAECGKLFGRKFFRDIKYVGISGGEPFLVEDLAERVEIILRKMPKLRSLTIITNGGRPEKIKADMERILEAAAAAGVKVNLCVSFDGLGAHDIVRGRAGAEAKALTTITELDRVFRGRLRLEVDFTISSANVESMERTWFHFRGLDIPVKFRLAVPIARLHNADMMAGLELDRSGRLQVCEFLDKLIYAAGLSWRERHFYKSLQQELLTGVRKRGCVHGYNAVGLDSRGRIFYCAPQSNILNDGPADADRAYFSKKNLAYRKEYTRLRCRSCHHDYPGPVNADMLRQIAAIKLRRARNGLLFLASFILSHAPGRTRPRTGRGNRRAPGIAVHGWYGTETTGDKAILGGVIEMLERLRPGRPIRVFSSMPHFTMRSLDLIGRPDIEVMKYDLRSVRASLRRGDLPVIGGGPLMDLPSLLPIEYAFTRWAVPGWVLGCGLGPLHSPFFRRSVGRILDSAGTVLLRDEGSAAAAVRLAPKSACPSIAGDPAIYFFRDRRPKAEGAKRRGVGFALRTVQRQYFPDKQDFPEIERRFNGAMAGFIRSVARDSKVSFLPMSTHFRGFDDREYHLKLAGNDPTLRTGIELGSPSPEEIVSRIEGLECLVAMRFHSLLFAVVAETPFLPVMYDLGLGKIGSLIKDLGLERFSMSAADFSAGEAGRKLAGLREEREAVVAAMRAYKTRKRAEFERFLAAAGRPEGI
jgi:polysaccharide pyruvyl transferase WcaK-like protein/MoaA/NifB/PqqE/SkfB family radical SAM enzyme